MPLRLSSTRPFARSISVVSPHRTLAMSASSQSNTAAAANGARPASRFAEPASRIDFEYSKGPDVWSVFNPINFPTAVNLGQGFMNWAPSPFVKNAFIKAAEERVDVHHYSHPKGRPRLRKAVAEYVGKSFHKPASAQDDAPPAQGQLPQVRKTQEPLDVETEVQITAGANGGIYSVLTAFLEAGDEVIFFEPFFDQYEAEVMYNGGVPVCLPLIPPSSSSATSSSSARNPSSNEWQIPFDELREKCKSGKVKVLMVNTPHNPVGKVFTLQEIQKLAAIAIEFDLLVIADEVYDCLTFDGQEHLRIASLEGMWERTITVGSAGKTFSCTGWRVGWCVGAPHLIKATLAAHVRIVFCCNSTGSEAAAIGLEEAPNNGYFPKQIQEYADRREILMKALDGLGMPYSVPHGAYFIMADASSLELPADFEYPDSFKNQPRDYKMAYFLAKTCDVVCIPATAFSSKKNAHLYENYLRFAFCKDNEIEEAAKRLEKIRPFLKQKK